MSFTYCNECGRPWSNHGTACLAQPHEEAMQTQVASLRARLSTAEAALAVAVGALEPLMESRRLDDDIYGPMCAECGFGWGECEAVCVVGRARAALEQIRTARSQSGEDATVPVAGRLGGLGASSSPLLAAGSSRSPSSSAASPAAEGGECSRCEGCGQIADSESGEAWTHWRDLPPGSDIAVRMGIVKPMLCPRCHGTGRSEGGTA